VVGGVNVHGQGIDAVRGTLRTAGRILATEDPVAVEEVPLFGAGLVEASADRLVGRKFGRAASMTTSRVARTPTTVVAIAGRSRPVTAPAKTPSANAKIV
jgi:hypothetical protein